MYNNKVANYPTYYGNIVESNELNLYFGKIVTKPLPPIVIEKHDNLVSPIVTHSP